MIAPIAMWPLDFSLVRNEVSNDVNLSMWRCAIAPLLPARPVAESADSG